MTYLLFAVALSLSAVAAYYAVMGLVAIFAAAVVPIAIMGTLLEASKLTVASWLYQNWKEIPTLLKSYFTIALVVLMLLTSMGIFGFLSKAHLDQAVPSGDVAAKLALIDEKIKTEKENLNASRTELNQLDQQVNQTMSRTDDSKGAERAIAIRRGQQKDRARILAEIGASQTKIAKLNEERAPIASEVRKVEAEVGPIKYIAALIYEESASEEVLEKAVRIVTMLIVLVFDPLAVLMLIAANWNMKHNQDNHWTEFFKKEKSDDFPEKNEIIEEENKIPEEPQELKENLDIPILEGEETWASRVIDEQPKDWDKSFYDRVGSELPEIQVDEPTKDITPETYEVRRGDVVTKERYPDNKDVPPKTASFMRKMADFLRPSPDGTIEKDVETLQKK